MCRFQCKDPETCQMPRFVVSPVKEPRHFVRNQNVKCEFAFASRSTIAFFTESPITVFSPSSESDTDDEFDCLPIDQSSRAMCTAEEDSACSSDSGFVSRQSKENMMENEVSTEQRGKLVAGDWDIGYGNWDWEDQFREAYSIY
jgi:hypothetical protein